MGMFRSTWTIFRRHSAYCCATILCLMAIALLAASCGTVWFTANAWGFVFIQNGGENGTIPIECWFEYTLEDSLFSLELNLNGKHINCDYKDGDCNRGLAPGHCTIDRPIPVSKWDLTHYKNTYSALFSFIIMTLVLLVILAIILQVICWAKKVMPPVATLVLVILALTIVVIALAFQLIAWSILFDHPNMARLAIDDSENDCPGGDSNSQEKGGFLCTFNGNYFFGEFQVEEHRFLGYEFRHMTMNWGPSTGWVLLTIAFGLTVFVFLLTVGWRPAFRRD
eukprot:TRINITY_DN919_c0_g1_i1.p1 TRINITY_DN919_c0_g1~~TRINITY_DN919_c0_g1_i1.p1  ORF type:complete len:281 (-),score=17.29 TRINITY_DN919_c0_g1_i1:53-895(-)